MTDFNELLDMMNPMTLTDGEFELSHETGVWDDDIDEETNQTLIHMVDSDGDGTISISYDPNHFGVSLRVTSLTGEDVNVSFHKSQLKQFLSLALTSLERSELIEQEDEQTEVPEDEDVVTA